MGKRERAKQLLLVVATAGLTACEEDGSTNPPSPPLECVNVAHSSWQGLWATGWFNKDPEDDPLAPLLIQLNHDGEWTEPPVVTALSGMTISAFNESRTIVARMDDGATTASFHVRGQLADPETTCDVDRTFTVTIDEENKVEITRHDALPFLPHRRASLDPRRHASFDVMRCDGGDVGLRAPGGDGNERVPRTKAAGTTEATADVARGDAGRRDRATTRRRG
ncbi:hypothetical protein [Sorangium atrum]|uniref:Lipoprotein n=1 Tax=Sorangium atrum TaxID=2995308 RepID=A0ABT5CDX9_9BACT|nr:hypothetical protein [Sorangium aterium]MDC0683332.1 hypothetical protein [Sorangium aterium]